MDEAVAVVALPVDAWAENRALRPGARARFIASASSQKALG